jgi:hypothetical protein
MSQAAVLKTSSSVPGGSDSGQAGKPRYFLLGGSGQTMQPLPLGTGQAFPRRPLLTA